MQTLRNFAFAALSAVMMASSALGQVATGAWLGKLKLNIPAAALKNPQTLAQVQQGMQIANKMVFHLTLKRDKTYIMKVDGAPGGSPKDSTDTGSWTQKGDAVTFNSSTNKGKSVPVMKISANGKSGTITMPGGAAKIVFSLVK